jgi:putative peptidoglycan binding protein
LQIGQTRDERVGQNQMSTQYTVQPGDYLMLIALNHGFTDWRLIYDHPDNQALRESCPNPDVLLPGDVVIIPDNRRRIVNCGTDEAHHFRVKLGPEAKLIIALKDEAGQSLSNEAYTLKLAAKEIRGKTDGDGLITASIPLGLSSGHLALDNRPYIVWELLIGNLDPVAEPISTAPIGTGIQARLNNLGFDAGPVDGDLGPKTSRAIARFQKVCMRRADPDGAPDADSCNRLVAEHGV